MKSENISELFNKYLNGECTPEETAAVEAWYLSAENRPDDIRLLNLAELENLERKMLNHIKVGISSPAADEELPEKASRSVLGFGFYRAAAALLILILAGIGSFVFYKKATGPLTATFASNNESLLQISNNTSSPAPYKLSDGSLIMLQPGGTLKFPAVFANNKRDLELVGEAFFDVAKDKTRPFIISTKDVTVKVLGTSFNVKACKDAREIRVAVKTGKVSVSAKKFVNKTSDEVLLTPNQEAIYNTIEANFSKKLVDRPQIIVEKPTLVEMKYDAIPVAKIFKSMEENYGIDIVYDERRIEACTLTTSLSEEGLLERIEIICQAIGAKYEIHDGRILIKTSGCL